MFFNDAIWQRALDVSKPRATRMRMIAEMLVSMDLTNPDPRCKQRIVALMSLGDPWISESPTKAKITLGELTKAMKRQRPPLRSSTRPHLADFPKDVETACDMLAGFGGRVYGKEGFPNANPPYSSAEIDAAVRATVLRWSNKAVRENAPRQSSTTSTLMIRPPPAVPTIKIGQNGGT